MKISINFNKLIFAIVLIGIGVGLLLDNFNIIQFEFWELFKTYWPIFLIYVGLKMIFDGFRVNRLYSGGWFFNFIIGLMIGLLGWNFLADNIGWTSINFSLIWNVFWPLVLIFIGFKILFRRKTPFVEVISDYKKVHNYGEDTIVTNEEGEARKKKRYYKSSLIGDINMGKDMFELEDLHLWNGIGDVDLDLSKAILIEGETQVTVSGWIGDIDIFVPKDLPVQVNMNLWIGEYRIFDQREDGINKNSAYKSPDYDDAVKKVRIHIDIKIGDVRIIEV